VAIVTALLHVFVFGALIGAFDTSGGRVFLGLIALPVLLLHVLIWLVARFSTVWSIVAALALNILCAGAGYIIWDMKAGQGSISADVALGRVLWFVLAGLIASALLIGWLRFTRPRPRIAGS
jgi:hypothetical protein